MSKQQTETKAHVLTEGEQKEVLTFFEQIISDPSKQAMIKPFFEVISQMIRAFEGKPLDGDYISRLTDVKNILERTDFPTYPLLREQVFLRLCATIYPNALKSWGIYADLLAQAFISYKRQSRKEYVEQTKGLQSPEQVFMIGDRTQQVEQPQKRRFGFLRGKPKEEREFVAQ